MSQRTPQVAALLSVVIPGLGQIYNDEHPKGLAILCISLGVWFGIYVSIYGHPVYRSVATVIMLGIVYVFTWIPAVVDAYQKAAGRPEPILSGTKRWYVIVMLLCVGPMALPLLWQSPRFSQGAKFAWTAAVILILVGAIAMLIILGPVIERALQAYQQLLGP